MYFAEEGGMVRRLMLNDEVDGWQLLRRLGKGGNGEVWVARRGGDEAALKVLKTSFQRKTNKRFLRFRDEALMHQKLASLHLGVLPFVDYCIPDDPSPARPAWLATALAHPAQKQLRGRTVSEVVAAISEIAETLARLHAEGISHRDIKPSNLYSYENRWVLGDFGLVDFPDKDAITTTGERLGPWNYIAPEMLVGGKDADGGKADVHSLAKTLWVLATEQRSPPPGEQRVDTAQFGIGGFRFHSKARQLDSLIDRSTKNNPEDRPSMAEFAAELRAWLSTSVVQPPPDLSALLARVREQTTPSIRAHQERLQQGEEAGRLCQRLCTIILPIAQAFLETGMSDGSISESDSAGRLFRRPQLLGTPVAFWERGLAVVARKPGTPSAAWSQGFDSQSLVCGIGVEVRVDGNICLFGGYVIESRYGPEFIGFWERVSRFGSALQEKAVLDLSSHLNATLGEALGRFLQWIEAGGEPPKPYPYQNGQVS
jgi:serine/threonine protein kinase